MAAKKAGGARVSRPEPPQEIVAADAQQHEPGRMLVERSRQPLERLRGDFAGYARAQHRVARQMLQLGALAASGERQGEGRSREAQG
jgi:hypothetical protein